MDLIVNISGEEYRSDINYTIQQQLGATATSDIVVLVEPSQPTPRSLMRCSISEGAETVFVGLISDVETPGYYSPHQPAKYKLTIESMEKVFQFRLVSEAYENSFTHEIITDLFDKYMVQEGLTLGTVSISEQQYEDYNCSFTKLDEILNELAGDVNATYYIDNELAFHFIIGDDFQAVSVPEKITNLKLLEETGDIRSSQIVTGATEKTDEQSESTTWTTDRKSWTVGYQISSVEGMTINGNPVGVGIIGADEDDNTKTFLYTVGQQTIVLNGNATVQPGAGDIVGAVYFGFFEVIIQNQNDALISEISELAGTSGKIEVIITDETLRSLDDADNKANSLLEQYNKREQTLSCMAVEFDCTTLGSLWPIDRPDLRISGDFVVVQRTISDFYDKYKCSIKLKAKNFFSRYGTVLVRETKKVGTNIVVYKQSNLIDNVDVSEEIEIEHSGLTCYPVGSTGGDLYDTGLPGFFPI